MTAFHLILLVVLWAIVYSADARSATSQGRFPSFSPNLSTTKRPTSSNNSPSIHRETTPAPSKPSVTSKRNLISTADTTWYFMNCTLSKTTTNLSKSAFEHGKTFIYFKIKTSAGILSSPLVWVDNELGKPLVTYHSSFRLLSLGTFNRNIKTIYFNLAGSCESNNGTLFSTILRLLPGVLNQSAQISSLCNFYDMHVSTLHLNTNGYAFCCQLSKPTKCEKLYGDDTLKTVASLCLTFFSPLILFYLIPRLEEAFQHEDELYIGLTEVTPLQLAHPVQLVILGLHRGPRVIKKVGAVSLSGIASIVRFMLPVVPVIDTWVAVALLLSSLILMLVPVLLIQSAMQDGSRHNVCYGSFLDVPKRLRLKGRRHISNMLLHRMSFVFKRVFWKHWLTKRRQWRYKRCLQVFVFIWLFLLCLTPVIGMCTMFLNYMFVFKPLDHSRLKSAVHLSLYLSLLLVIVYCWSITVFTLSCIVFRCLEYTIKGLVKNHSYIFVDLLFALFVTHFVLNVLSKVNNQFISYKKLIFEEAERIKDVYPDIWIAKDGIPFIPKHLYNHVINTVFPVTMNELKVLGKLALGVLFFVIVRKSIEDFHIKWSAFGEGIVSAATFAIPGMLEYYSVGDSTTEYRLKHMVECALKEWLDQRVAFLHFKKGEFEGEAQGPSGINADSNSVEESRSAANDETRSQQGYLVKDETQTVCTSAIFTEGRREHKNYTIKHQSRDNNSGRGVQRSYLTPDTKERMLTSHSLNSELSNWNDKDSSHDEHSIGNNSNGNSIISDSQETFHVVDTIDARQQGNTDVCVDVHTPPSGYSWTVDTRL